MELMIVCQEICFVEIILHASVCAFMIKAILLYHNSKALYSLIIRKEYPEDNIPKSRELLKPNIYDTGNFIAIQRLDKDPDLFLPVWAYCLFDTTQLDVNNNLGSDY
jgi:hypothetical protein